VDLQRLVHLEIFDVGEPGARIGGARQGWRGACILRDSGGAERCGLPRP
jgi:hypothetical protein